MAKKLYEEASVQDIAVAIREKTCGTETYKVAQMGNAVRGIASSPIVDDSLENTTQYRQMNLSAAEFIANVDYSENADDYSVTKVTPYYSAATAYSKEEPDGLKIKVPANTALTVAQGGKTRSDAVSGAGVIYNMEPLKAGTFAFINKNLQDCARGRCAYDLHAQRMECPRPRRLGLYRWPREIREAV